MPGLLVSVRDGEEACAALRGSADLIDIKEPRAGALGAADPRVWREVLARVQGARPVSAALGELAEPEKALHARAREATGLAFVKVGLAHMADTADWPHRWRGLQNLLPTDTSLVSVVYADWQVARAPLPHAILEQCAATNCRWALVDTFQKTSGRLLECISHVALRSIVLRARSLGMRLVLAGSLTCDDLPQVIEHQADYIGVRGAACHGGRNGRICEELVRQLSSSLHLFSSTRTNQRSRAPSA